MMRQLSILITSFLLFLASRPAVAQHDESLADLLRRGSELHPIALLVLFAAIIFLGILLMLWLLLPFAVFGTQSLLKKLIANQKETNKLLSKMANRSDLKGESLRVLKSSIAQKAQADPKAQKASRGKKPAP